MNKGLETIVENKKLYPITILPSLTNYLMEIFASQRMMIVQDILEIDVKKFCQENRIKQEKILSLINEAKTLMGD